ncbi:Oidioi.mRNA.OKI2018_I69.chr1.g2440.t1.cds [Oikopleura dioica]|uniref:Oidioi.mRNA.OKI2018_I69.chr1.g2440.t1.cds n=1 Tax=Oikopleura dioica TaxID=34765 RepID=A0ABN7SUM4_OIKDI|nr:Oidioi.mRNA.OKI2018_I69.chr1.g2440.t1.cds [Oikopleura dioica]
MPALTNLDTSYMPATKVLSHETVDEIADEKHIKRLNTKTNGFAAGSSIINSGLFVQNVAQLKIILGKQRRCENFCGPEKLTEAECVDRIRNATQESSIFRDFDCNFTNMAMLKAFIITSIIMQVIYGLVVIIDVAIGEKALGASITSSDPKATSSKDHFSPEHEPCISYFNCEFFDRWL